MMSMVGFILGCVSDCHGLYRPAHESYLVLEIDTLRIFSWMLVQGMLFMLISTVCLRRYHTLSYLSDLL